MPLELQIIQATEFVRITPTGELDLGATKAALAHLARACRKRNLERALLDLRSLAMPPTPRFSPTDLAGLIASFEELGFTPGHRLAVLYTIDPHHGARMFAFIGALHGWSIRAFGTFEDAMLWLSEPVPKEQPGVQEQRVPIRAQAGSLRHPRHA